MLAGLNLGFYDWLSAFTYGLIAVSYSMRDMRLLRTITVVACFVDLFVYYNIRPGQPMWVSFGMSILFIAINGYQLWTLWRDSRTSDFSAEESFMYGTVFSSLQPGEFRRLLSLGRYDMVPAGASWVRAGAPVSSVALIVAGEASVMLDETVVSRLKRGDFIGEMGYITRQPASAAVQAASSALIGPAPLPLVWWHAAQLAAYTFSPRFISSSSTQSLAGSSALAAISFFSPSTHLL